MFSILLDIYKHEISRLKLGTKENCKKKIMILEVRIKGD